ncbi:MAG TPA: hypothetical protein VF815_15835 [Myxococcaceae bacterium]|jgi:hypothetical protein
MLKVAIAGENPHYDMQVYGAVLSLVLQQKVEVWNDHGYRFSGWKSVLHHAPLFLKDAAGHGIQRALLAIDNDGGSRRRLEHQPSHVSNQQARNVEDGCAECLLEESIPENWKHPPLYCCIAVPVQTLETWLLVVSGHPFKESSPEKRYSRPVLKKDLFGDPHLPQEKRLEKALDVLKRPDALERLRQRPSFQRFEARLAGWKMPTDPEERASS